MNEEYERSEDERWIWTIEFGVCYLVQLLHDLFLYNNTFSMLYL